MKFKLILITLIVLTFVLFALNLAGHEAAAIDMSSENYKIESGDFNMASGYKSSANFQISDIVGAASAQEFNSKGFIIRTGLPYLTGNEPFTFSIDNTQIDFGDLSPNQPKVASSKIIVQNGLSNGYQILSGEKGPLESLGGAAVPDTKCDDVQKPCTPNKANIWVNSSTLGFGFDLNGKTANSDFKDTSYYRPFAALSAGQLPVQIMKGNKAKSQDQAIINFKVNISATQPVGKYQNTISFIALPGY